MDSNNVLRSYVVATRHDILNDSDQATDLFIGTITTTIPTSDHVGFVPYLNLPGEAGYENQDLMVLGKPARGGIGSIESFIDMSGGGINLTRGFIFRFEAPPPNNLPDDDCHGEIGDSGSPSFVLSNGQAAIVGTHTSIDEAGGDELTYDTFVPHYIDELNAIMASDGYHMTEATPAETTIAITQTPPAGPIRAGYPFTIGIGLENTGANHANNLKLTDTLNDDWQDATPLILSSSSTPASAELDRISVEFAASPQLRRYFRVKIVLTEN